MAVIVVTGTPGTGKSEFASRLSERLNYEYVDLNGFLIDAGCTTGYDDERQSHIIDLARGKTLVEETFSRGRFVLESHLAHLTVPKAMTSTCFVLRCSPYLLMERLRARGFSERKVKENCAAEILDTILLEAIERYGRDVICELDASRDLEVMVEEAVEVLRGDRPRVVGDVDWLTLVSERDDLSLFFE